MSTGTPIVTSRLDPEVKAKWLEALRSGHWPQTTGNLRILVEDPDYPKPGLCCLGVLCEVAIESGLPLDRDETTPNAGYALATSERHSDYRTTELPPSVARWAGLAVQGAENWANPRVPVDVVGRVLGVKLEGHASSVHLSELNDGITVEVDGEVVDDYRLTFAQIADVIEAAL